MFHITPLSVIIIVTLKGVTLMQEVNIYGITRNIT